MTPATPVSEPSVRVLAPAKLTVSLRVTGVRADGYHELESEMVALSLADELVLTEGGSSGVTVVAEPGTRAEASNSLAFGMTNVSPKRWLKLPAKSRATSMCCT